MLFVRAFFSTASYWLHKYRAVQCWSRSYDTYSVFWVAVTLNFSHSLKMISNINQFVTEFLEVPFIRIVKNKSKDTKWMNGYNNCPMFAIVQFPQTFANSMLINILAKLRKNQYFIEAEYSFTAYMISISKSVIILGNFFKLSYWTRIWVTVSKIENKWTKIVDKAVNVSLPYFLWSLSRYISHIKYTSRIWCQSFRRFSFVSSIRHFGQYLWRQELRVAYKI